MPYTCPSCATVYAVKPPGIGECDDCSPTTEACDACIKDCADSNCADTLCLVHQLECQNCMDVFCSSHTTDCGACGIVYCDDCATDVLDCTLCGDDGCINCLQSCDVCEQRYCASCMRTCTTCGKEVCRGHALYIMNNPAVKCQNCIDTHLATTPTIVACEQSVVAALDKSSLALFNPPIELFEYSKKKKNPKPNTTQDWQAEHPIPNSCFILGTGRKGPTVHYAGSYSEGKALTFWIADDQSAGEEHKFITDYEREFTEACRHAGQFPTVQQWFQVMENGWKDMILYFRAYNGPTGSNATETENLRQATAARAAHALRVTLENHYFKTLKIDKKKCRTKVGFNTFLVPSANPSAATQFNGF